MIKRKADVEHFLYAFCLHAEWDGAKFYVTIADEQDNGTITLMQYAEGSFTVHRKNERFCDRVETEVEGDALVALIWKNRKYINRLQRVY
jgi:hypothetical protein